MEKVKKEIEYERAEVTSKYATLTDDEKDVEHLKQKQKTLICYTKGFVTRCPAFMFYATMLASRDR